MTLANGRPSRKERGTVMLLDFNANLDNPFDSTSSALGNFGVAKMDSKGRCIRT